MPRTNAKNQSQSRDDESDDGGHFDHCEPIFKFTQPVDLHGIERHQRGRDQHHPDPLRNIGQPERNVNAGSGDFSADGDDLRDSVCGSNRKTRPAIEILLRINSERARDRMHDRHLRQHIGHDQSDARSQKIGKNDRGSGKANGYTAAQKQTHADGAAERHHRQLPLAKTPVQAFRFRRGKLVTGLDRRKLLVTHNARSAESMTGHFGQRVSEPAHLFERVVVHQGSSHCATLFGEPQSLHQPRRIHVAIAYADISV